MTAEESKRIALLEAVGGTHLTVTLVASVWGVCPDETRDGLQAMAELGLVRTDVEPACCARYSVDSGTQELMVPYPVGRGVSEEGIRRALAYYRQLAQELNLALSQKRLRTYDGVPVSAMVRAYVATHAPLEVFGAERAAMLAAIEAAARGSIEYPWWEIGEAAWPVFRAAGFSQAGSRMLSLCADACPDVTERDRTTKARLLAQAAHCLCDVGDLTAARRRIDEAIAIADGLSRDGLGGRVHASVHEFNGTILREEGFYDDAESEYKLALEFARRIGRSRSESIQLYLMGRVRLVRGHYTTAVTYLNEALALASADDTSMRAGILAYRSRAHLGLGNIESCTKDAWRAVELYGTMPAPWRLVGVLETLAEAYRRAGKADEAQRVLEAARAVGQCAPTA